MVSGITPTENHDFDFIHESNYCHVMSLRDAELFDLDAVEECRSVLVARSLHLVDN